jgi:hypothetical protein
LSNRYYCYAQPPNPAAVGLPVKLINFKAIVIRGSSYLTWQTSLEANSSLFVVEHSVDGVQWTKAGSLNAAGNSSVTRSYSYTHAQPVEGLNYYRLKTVDLDGYAELSAIITLTHNKPHGIRVYPVPVSAYLNIEVRGFAGSIPYTITDAKGKALKRGIIRQHKQRIAVQDLTTGVYFFKTQQFGPVKFVK